MYGVIIVVLEYIDPKSKVIVLEIVLEYIIKVIVLTNICTINIFHMNRCIQIY